MHFQWQHVVLQLSLLVRAPIVTDSLHVVVNAKDQLHSPQFVSQTYSFA